MLELVGLLELEGVLSKAARRAAIGGKRKTRENMGSLLHEMGDLVPQDMGKAEEQNASFASLLARPIFRNPRSQKLQGRLEQGRHTLGGRGSGQGRYIGPAGMHP